MNKTSKMDAAAYTQRGNEKSDNGDFEGAIDDYTKAIEIAPDIDYYYCRRGELKVKLKFYKEAIDDYTKAIELSPTWKWYYLMRGDVYGRWLQLYQEAIDDYTAYLEFGDTVDYLYRARTNKFRIDTSGYERLSIIYYRTKEYDKAMEHINKAIELAPDCIEAQNLKEMIMNKISKAKL
jgi:tetratricopeptide (TPR) repeat protein